MVTDLNNDGTPDFVVVNIDHPDSGNTLNYRMGGAYPKREVSRNGTNHNLAMNGSGIRV